MQPLEDMADTLGNTWSPIAHLHSVMETEALREAYNHTLPALTEYHTEISQNKALYETILFFANSPAFAQLNAAQRKIIENDIRDFKLSGVNLPDDKKARMAELEQRLSKLTTQFAENLLDATHAWTLHFTDQKSLAGLPPQALQLAADNAKLRKLEGYVLTLDYPSYSTAIQFLDDRQLRHTIYEAYVTRASDTGPYPKKWDNTHIMEDILRVRHEMAALVGYKNYADYSLATKMAKSPDEVLRFLKDLLSRSKPMAVAEIKELEALAKQLDNIDQLEPWDVPYYSEKLQANKFQFTQE
jgi:oligopeptidase A